MVELIIEEGRVDPTSAKPGERVYIHTRVMNPSTTEYVSATWNFEIAGRGGNNVPISFSPEVSKAFSQGFDIPADMPEGNYALTIYTQEHSKTFPNAVTIGAAPPPPPAEPRAIVDGTPLLEPQEPEEGTQVKVTATITNVGGEGLIWAEIRDEADNLLTEWDSTIAANNSRVIEVFFGMPPGDYTYKIICGHVKNGSRITDDTYQKTISAKPPQPPPPPDEAKPRIVKCSVSPAEAKPGETVTINTTLENEGGKAADWTWNFEVTGHGGEHQPVHLEPGEMKDVSQPWLIPADIAPGMYAVSIYLADIYLTFFRRIEIIAAVPPPPVPEIVLNDAQIKFLKAWKEAGLYPAATINSIFEHDQQGTLTNNVLVSLLGMTAAALLLAQTEPLPEDEPGLLAWLENLIAKGAPYVVTGILALPRPLLNLLFVALLKTEAGKNLFETVGNMFGDRFFDEADLPESWRNTPTGSLSLLAILGIIMAIVGVGTIINWFAKEMPEPAGMAVWALIEEADTLEMWYAARDANEKYGELITKAKSLYYVVGWLNPVIRLYMDELTDSQLSNYEGYKAVIDAKIAELEPLPPPVPPEEKARITFTSTPAGAKIYLNDVYVYAETNTLLLLDPAHYKVTVKLSGYEDATREIDVATAEVRTIDFEMVEIPPPPPAPSAKLVIKSEPTGAKIYVDDVYKFEVTDTTLDVVPGHYKLTLKLIDYEDATQEVDVVADEIKNVFFTLDPKPLPPTPGKGKLVIKSEPRDAKIYLDDVFTYEYTNTTLDVEPGHHKVTLKLEGYEDAEKEFDIEEGQELAFEIPLFLKPPPPPVPPEHYVLISTGGIEGAKIILDGNYTFLNTPATMKLEARDWIIRLEKSGYDTLETPLTKAMIEAGVADFSLIESEVPPVTPVTPPAAPPYTPPISITVPITLPSTAYSPAEYPAPSLYVPGAAPTEKPSGFEPSVKTLVVDIETTGDEPWNSRLICIGIKDATMPETPGIVIMKDSERDMLSDFLQIVKEGGFREIVGYHVGFDFRYLLTKCMFHRLPAKELYDCELIDVMQIMTQIKSKFVYGYRKSGTLDDWMKFLLGKKKPLDYEQLMKAYLEGKHGLIREYNLNDVQSTFEIWVLAEYVFKTEFELEALASAPAEAAPITRKCPRCLQELSIPGGMSEFKCPVCNEDVITG